MCGHTWTAQPRNVQQLQQSMPWRRADSESQQPNSTAKECATKHAMVEGRFRDEQHSQGTCNTATKHAVEEDRFRESAAEQHSQGTCNTATKHAEDSVLYLQTYLVKLEGREEQEAYLLTSHALIPFLSLAGDIEVHSLEESQDDNVQFWLYINPHLSLSRGQILHTV